MTTVQQLTIVIPTRNRFDALMRCLESIANSTLLPEEVIIIDDQSSDETAQLTSNSVPKLALKILRPVSQLMMAGARNAGARAASGKLILFIDDDNVIDKHMVEQLVTAAKKNPTYGHLGPVMYTLATRQVQTAYQKFSFVTGYTYGPAVIPPNSLVASDGIPNVFMVRRTVFDQCGYFDSDLLATYSEIDLDLRARRAGWKCGIVTAAKTYHDNHPHRRLIPRTMGGGTFPQKSYCMIRNRMVMVRRFGRWWEQVIFLVVFSWFWPLFYSLLMLRHRRFDLVRLYWLGWRDGVRFFITGRLTNSFST